MSAVARVVLRAEIYPVRAAVEEVAAREAAVRLGGNVAALEAELDGHEFAELHRPVLDALRAGDAEAAGAALRRHVEHFGELLKGAVP